MTSPDGINWTIRSSAADNDWHSIAWSPELGLFAAVSENGTGNRVMTSPDGINWTIRSSAANNGWVGIAWSPELGLFAAVSYSGVGNRVMTSPTGTGNNALRINIDNELKDMKDMGGVSVPDTSANWTFIQNYSMPYMEYQKITIGGTLQQEIEYECDDTVFSDLSGNSHPAYPTFRTGTSDPHVGASLVSFTPIAEAQAPAWVLGVAPGFFSENITTSGNFTTTPTPTAAPGIAVVEAIAAAGSTPSQLPFILITGFAILAVSLTTSWFLKKYGARNIWVKIIVITGLMGFAIAVQIFDFWMLLFFLFMAIAVALFSRQRSLG